MGIPHISESGVISITTLLSHFPSTDLSKCLPRVFPYRLLLVSHSFREWHSHETEKRKEKEKEEKRDSPGPLGDFFSHNRKKRIKRQSRLHCGSLDLFSRPPKRFAERSCRPNKVVHSDLNDSSHSLCSRTCTSQRHQHSMMGTMETTNLWA
jgi:hypothetical protein